MQLAPPQSVQHQQQQRKHQQRGRANVPQKVVEAQPGRRAYHDVGWIADQRRRPADIGGKNHAQQIGGGILLQFPSQQQHNRRNQQHRGDVIQQGGEQRGNHRLHQHHPPRVGLHPLGAPDCHVLKHPGFLHDGHNHHHPGQQANGIQVECGKGLRLMQHAHHHHQPRPQQGHHRTVEFFSEDTTISQGKHPHRHHGWTPAPQHITRQHHRTHFSLLAFRAVVTARPWSAAHRLPRFSLSTNPHYGAAHRGKVVYWQ